MRDRRGFIRRRVVVGPLVAPVTEGARVLVLVEGASDRIAVEVAAERLGRDLTGVVVLDAGGIGSIGALAARFGPAGQGVPLVGLCDAAEVAWLCKALRKAGVGVALDTEGLARLGFFVCGRDLEDEFIRALGEDSVLELVKREGDLTAFRTLQRQKVWAGAAFTDQMRRFLGAGAGRKTRYAGVFAGAVAVQRMPQPLVSVLDALPGLRAGPVLV